MSEVRAVELFAEVVNPKFEIKQNDGYYSWIGIKRNYDASKTVKVHVEGDIWSEKEPKICHKKTQNGEDVILFFKDLLIQFSGNIKSVHFANYDAFKHTLVFVVTESKVHFYDVYFDETKEARKFSYLGEIENTQLLYMSFNEFKKDDFVKDIKKKAVKEIYSQLFLEIRNSSYGNNRFGQSFTLIKGTNMVTPFYFGIFSGYNNIFSLFSSKEGYKAQKLFNIVLNENAAAVMKAIDFPMERVVNAGFHWIITETKIILLDTLEVFDISFIKRQKGKKISLEHRLHTQMFDIRSINNKRILIIRTSDNRYILWNLNENKTFLYSKPETSTNVSMIYLSDNENEEDNYCSWSQSWFPHIFLKSENMIVLPDEEKQYEIYYNFKTGEPLSVTSVGKPYILKCKDGRFVYFIKTYDIEEKDKITGMMIVLDKDYNFVESRSNINLIAIYDGNACSNVTFAFVEEDK